MSIKEVYTKFKNLDKKGKEKIFMKMGVVFLAIYFLLTWAISNGEIKEEIKKDNENLSIQEMEKIEDPFEEEKIYIHLTGYIKNPGVLELKAGTRLSQAIEKAGGLKEGAEIKYLNLAKKLQDGEKIYIPNLEEVKKFEMGQNNLIGDTNRYIEENKIAGDENISSATEPIKDNLININKADKNELVSIPGVGDTTAENIIKKRKEIGNFKKIEDIMEVDGIGESKFNKMKDKITV